MKFEMQGADEISKRLRALTDLADHIENETAGVITQIMRKTAVDRLTGLEAVDTGLLRNSVEAVSNGFTERPDDSTVSVGIQTEVPYAMFIEYGTGPLGDPEVPHTSKMKWVYPAGMSLNSNLQMEMEFRVAHSQPARPFMRPALYDNRKAFVKAINDTIDQVYREA